MATRRETLIGGFSLVACAACRGNPAVPGTGDTGVGSTTTDTTTSDTIDTGTGPPPQCKEKSTQSKVVLCLDEHPKLDNVDGSEIVDSDSGSLIVVRTTNKKVIALSSRCTHAGCDVNWQKSSSTLYCPCHGSEFAADGSVVRGPANRPLASYDASLVVDTITITL